MEYRQLGGSDFKVPVLSFGTGTFGGKGALFSSWVRQFVDALDEVATETGKTVPQIALNWLLQRPTVASIIVGARNEEQLKQNLGALGWNLTAEQVKKLDDANALRPAYPHWHQRGVFSERNPSPV